jgi:hypothetical protein
LKPLFQVNQAGDPIVRFGNRRHGIFGIVEQQLVKLVPVQLVGLLEKDVEDAAEETVQLLKTQRQGNPVPEKDFGNPVLVFFTVDILTVLFRQVFAENLVAGQPVDDLTQIFFVNILKIIVDDVLDRRSKSLEDVEILREREPFNLQGMGQQVELSFYFDR